MRSFSCILISEVTVCTMSGVHYYRMLALQNSAETSSSHCQVACECHATADLDGKACCTAGRLYTNLFCSDHFEDFLRVRTSWTIYTFEVYSFFCGLLILVGPSGEGRPLHDSFPIPVDGSGTASSINLASISIYCPDCQHHAYHITITILFACTNLQILLVICEIWWGHSLNVSWGLRHCR